MPAMNKAQRYIMVAYALSILLINIFVPYIAQKSMYVGKSIHTEIVTGNYAFFWNLPNRFELAATGLNWKVLMFEYLIVTAIAIMLIIRYK
jgi:hypothetical protein